MPKAGNQFSRSPMRMWSPFVRFTVAWILSMDLVVAPARIAALAASNQRETAGFLDAAAARLREITGKTPDITPPCIPSPGPARG